DKANHEDKNKLVAEWPNICQKVEEQGKSSLRALLHGSNPIAASESKVLIGFEKDVHSELINQDNSKTEELEKLIHSEMGTKAKEIFDSSIIEIKDESD